MAKRGARTLARTASTAGDGPSRRLARGVSAAEMVAVESERSATDLEVEGAAPAPVVNHAERPPPPPPRDEGPVNADFVRALLSDHASRISQQVQRMQQTIATSLDQNLATTLGQLDAGYQRRFASIEGVVQEHQVQLDGIRGELLRQSQRLAEGEAAIYRSATQRVEQAVDDEAFNREIDNKILKLRTQTSVSVEAARLAIASTLADMELSADAVSLVGGTFGKSYVLQFSGSDVVQRARAKKFVLLQKLSNSEYRKLEASDTSGNRIPVFVEPDKNPRMVKTETLARRLKKILGQHTRSEFSVRRSDQTVFSGNTPVARIKDVTPESYRIEWSQEWKREHPSVDFGRVAAELSEAFVDRVANTSWG